MVFASSGEISVAASVVWVCSVAALEELAAGVSAALEELVAVVSAVALELEAAELEDDWVAAGAELELALALDDDCAPHPASTPKESAAATAAVATRYVIFIM